jgi:hypothetical protein
MSKWDYELSDVYFRKCNNCREYNDSKLGVKCAFMCHGCKKLLPRPPNTRMNPYANINGLLVPLERLENQSKLKAFICIS